MYRYGMSKEQEEKRVNELIIEILMRKAIAKGYQTYRLPVRDM